VSGEHGGPDGTRRQGRLRKVKSKTTILVLAAVLAVGALWLRHYLSPGEVVRRKLVSTVAAFEEERLLAVMAAVSRSYSDPWGGDYETLAGNLRQLMESYEDLRVDLVFGAIETRDDRVTVGLEFVVSGRFQDERESVLGSRAEPCTAVVLWRKETPGWRLASTLDLDIPELRDKLEQRRAGEGER
jgi:hypothetical protein